MSDSNLDIGDVTVPVTNKKYTETLYFINKSQTRISKH